MCADEYYTIVSRTYFAHWFACGIWRSRGTRNAVDFVNKPTLAHQHIHTNTTKKHFVRQNKKQTNNQFSNNQNSPANLPPARSSAVGYTMRDIRYFWKDGLSSVGMSSEVELPQFRVLGHRQRATEINLTTGTLSLNKQTTNKPKKEM